MTLNATLKTPPGPAPAKNLLAILRFFRDFKEDLVGVMLDGFKTYGDVHQFEIGSDLQVQVAHPDHIQQVLVTQAAKFSKDGTYTDEARGLARFLGAGLLTANGDFWKRQRKLMNPAFHHQRIQSYADIMIRDTRDMLDSWARVLDHGDGHANFDIDREMMHTTLKIVVEALFGTDISDDADRIGWAVNVMQEFSGTPQVIPSWIPTPLELRVRRAIRMLDDIIYRMIASHRPDAEQRTDLLSMLITAETEDGERMTDKQIRDEIVTLFLAGHETTANTLNWTWMALAQNPDVEAKLHAELDTVLGGAAPTIADLKRLPYTEMVIKESMRLYPPAFMVSRLALEDIEIGGFRVPKGATVGVVSIVAHRDPRWWGEDAAAFRPERFAPENEKSFPRYAYLPFGGGPRVCIGSMFAMMEAQLMLAFVAQNHTLRLLPGQQVRFDAKITLRPRGGLPMRVSRRDQHPISADQTLVTVPAGA
ncbi:MAG: cytochrome P450 [Chloroflexota bacterium]|nr:cytochrome P450 [Chloroflexota bacterium]